MPRAETLRNVFYSLVLASMLCAPSAVQTVSGSITGTVVDPSDGAPGSCYHADERG